MSVAENLKTIRERVDAACERAGRRPEEVTLIAVSKTKPLSMLQEAYGAGARDFGENKVQEILEKYPEMPEDARFHMIGHLQTNKVNKVVGRVSMIESVDSEHLLRKVDAAAARLGLTQDILIEINIGAEASKSGVAPEGLWSLAEAAEAAANLRLRGLMAIPPAGATPDETRAFFAEMRGLLTRLQEKHYQTALPDTLSMGMSGDFENAIREGATLVRIGTAIYGERDYSKKV